MKIPMQSITVIVISFLFVSSIFLGGYTFSQAKESIESENYSNGRVLGVSEAYTEAAKNNDGIYSLPKSDNVIILPPTLKNNGEKLSLSEGRGAVLDEASNNFLYQEEADKQVPIASITKLATALVFMDTNPNWNDYYELEAEDRTEGGMVYILTGEEAKIKDLFYLSLVGSANTATRAIVNSTGFNEGQFVAQMNLKMKELGLVKTYFEDPIGLGMNNVSTAFEVAKLAKIVLGNEMIQKISSTKTYSFNTLQGRKITVNSTNSLLYNYPKNGVKILGGKTGHTVLAGYCFVGKFADNENHEIITVFLGGDDINSRFRETKKMADWSYNNYVW